MTAISVTADHLAETIGAIDRDGTAEPFTFELDYPAVTS